jgi:hypothetical protein
MHILKNTERSEVNDLLLLHLKLLEKQGQAKPKLAEEK